MIQPGDVVIAELPGARATKRRPAVVVSSDVYHQNRPDVILALVTSNVAAANTPTDYVLQDWSAGGLRKPSAVRAFLFTIPQRAVTVVGRLTSADWDEVRSRLAAALHT